MGNKIQKAYHISKNIYDDVLTQGNIFSKLYIRLFWSGVDDREIARKMLESIPNDFSGELLDVPVGTAVFTHKKWKALGKAKIVCLDYSEDMLGKAKTHFEGCTHISCIQGDVGRLSMENETFDIVVSMNGFHAFPDKEKAWSEIYRVLKNGGRLIACFYIAGKSKRTDRLVEFILSKKGWFTPPFDTEETLKERLHQMYDTVNMSVDGSMVWFECVKKC